MTHYEKIHERGKPIGYVEPIKCEKCNDRGYIIKNGNYGVKKIYCTCLKGQRLDEMDPTRP